MLLKTAVAKYVKNQNKDLKNWEKLFARNFIL